jgi:hypothetical protein
MGQVLEKFEALMKQRGRGFAPLLCFMPGTCEGEMTYLAAILSEEKATYLGHHRSPRFVLLAWKDFRPLRNIVGCHKLQTMLLTDRELGMA